MANQICIITPDVAGPTRNGGIGTHCLYLARFHARRGDAVTIVHTGPPDDADRASWKDIYARDHGAQLVFLEELPDEPAAPVLPHTDRHRIAHRVFHWARARDFATIHFQDWQGNGAICVRAKQTGLAFSRTRLVVTAHGSSEWIRAGMHEFPSGGRETLIDDALERTAVALADTLVSPTRHLLAWMRERDWTLPSDTRVVPYLFEPPTEVAPARALLPAELNDIVFFGRFETRKGLEPFLDALGRLNGPVGNGTVLHVHFVGKPHTTLRGPAREVITRSAETLDGRIEVAVHEDWNHQEALAWLASHPQALVVAPSLADNAPFAVIECLALGQPLLAARRGGIPELVASPDHLVEPTSEALADRLAAVLRDGLPATVSGWSHAAAVAGWTELAAAGMPAPPSPAASPRISVCIPHFNHPDALGETLARLAGQTCAPHEVVVTDDGSQREHDQAWNELASRYRDKGWTFLRQTHAGPAAARNAAAQAATGDALVFCDADNQPLPDMLARLGTALATSGCDIVTCGFAAHAPAADGTWSEKPEYIFSPLGGAPELALLENVVGDTNFIVRRETFLALGGFDRENRAASEDWEFLLRAIIEQRPIAVVPEVVFRYRLAPASHARRHSSEEAAAAAWRALPANERQRYGRLLQTARGTFAERTDLVAVRQHVKHLETALAATQLHVGNIEMLNAKLRRDIAGAEDAISASNQLREQLKDMGLAQDQAAHDLAHQRETLEIARHELQVQEKRRQEMERRLNDRRNDVTHLRKAIEDRDRKIRRMQQTWSWRITAPARALRRKLLGRFSPGDDALGSSLEVQTAPYMISIDVPSVWEAAPAIGSFTGWCVSVRGTPARAIRALVGANEFSGRYGMRRADVALAHKFTAPDSAQCGFQIPYRLLVDAEYKVRIEVLNDDGEWLKVTERTLYTSSFPRAVRDYTAWVEAFGRATPERVGALRARLARLPTGRRPLLSVLLPVYNPPERFLERAIESVRNQIYDYWELCIADDGSTQPHVRPLLERFAREDPRMRVTFRTENGHISHASNTALELARGDFIVLLDHDDEISWDALAEVAINLATNPDTDVVYSDEDKIDDEERRYDPYFKPDFLPDLLTGQNCFSHLSVFRTKIVREVGGFRPGFEGSQDWDLALRVIDTSNATRVRHIPKVLYHWRAISGSTAIEVSEKSYSLEAARRAVLDHFRRRGMAVNVLPVPGAHWQVVYPLPEKPPLVTVVIPTRNAAKILRACVDSLFAHTSYEPYEIVVVNNRSDEISALALFEELAEHPHARVVKDDGPFNFSRLINFGVSHARGDVVVLLNNDVELIDEGWLTELVSHAVRPEIGAVGPMLYYPDGTIQHAGIVLGLGGVANAAFGHHVKGSDGYKNRARLAQNYSAVTAACLAVRREVFNQVGGFNENDLAIAFNDVDFCIRVRNAGYRNLWTPFAELIHHESVSRGREDTPEKQARFDREIAYMRATWGDQLDHDPAYNLNLALSMEGWDLAWPPRT